MKLLEVKNRETLVTKSMRSSAVYIYSYKVGGFIFNKRFYMYFWPIENTYIYVQLQYW